MDMAEQTLQEDTSGTPDDKTDEVHGSKSELSLENDGVERKKRKIIVYKEDGTLHKIEKYEHEDAEGASIRSDASMPGSDVEDHANSYMCIACDLKIPTLEVYEQHKLKEHGLYICTYCLEEFDDVTGRNEHTLSTHGKGNQNVNKNNSARKKTLKTYTCSVCDKTLKSINALKYHQQSYHNVSEKQNFKCDECDKVFTSSYGLTLHRSLHTGDKPHKCQENGCGKSFRLYSTFAKHQRMHADIKSYVCDECGKRFSQKDYLKSHMYKHTGQKLFLCNVCGKSFTQKGNLKVHMSVHKPVRSKLSCRWCDQSYFYKSYLTKHEKLCKTQNGSKNTLSEKNIDKNVKRKDKIRKNKSQQTPPMYKESGCLEDQTMLQKSAPGCPVVVRMVPYKVVTTETESGRVGTVLVPLNSQSAVMTTVNISSDRYSKVITTTQNTELNESSKTTRSIVSLVSSNSPLLPTGRDISCDEDSADLDVTSTSQLSSSESSPKTAAASIEECGSEDYSTCNVEKKDVATETVEMIKKDCSGEQKNVSYQSTVVNTSSLGAPYVNQYMHVFSANTLKPGRSLLGNLHFKRDLSTCKLTKNLISNTLPMKPKEHVQMPKPVKKFPLSFLSVPSNVSTKMVYVPLKDAYKPPPTYCQPNTYTSQQPGGFPVTRQLLNPSHVTDKPKPLSLYSIRRTEQNPPPYHSVKIHPSTHINQILNKSIGNQDSIFDSYTNTPSAYVKECLNSFTNKNTPGIGTVSLSNIRPATSDTNTDNTESVLLSEDGLRTLIMTTGKVTSKCISDQRMLEESAGHQDIDVAGGQPESMDFSNSSQFVVRVSDVNNVEEVLQETIYSSSETKPVSEVASVLDEIGSLYSIDDRDHTSTGHVEAAVHRDSMVHDITEMEEFLI